MCRYLINELDFGLYRWDVFASLDNVPLAYRSEPTGGCSKIRHFRGSIAMIRTAVASTPARFPPITTTPASLGVPSTARTYANSS
jgi:hypothetical protein